MKPMTPMEPMQPLQPLFEMTRDETPWWPAVLGEHPSSMGSTADGRYAYFAATQRLAVERAGTLQVYDTAEHDITGVSQRSAQGSELTFRGRDGEPVDLSGLQRLR